MSTKDKIKKKALKIILTMGLEGLSMRAIAGEVGIKGSSIYKHYKNRDSILNEIRVEALQKLRALMIEKAKNKKTPKSKLLSYGQAYIEFSIKNYEEFRLLFLELESDRKSLGDNKNSEVELYKLLTAEFGKLLKSNGEITKKVETMAYGFWSLAHGVSTLRQRHLAKFDVNFLKADIDIMKNFINGLNYSFS